MNDYEYCKWIDNQQEKRAIVRISELQEKLQVLRENLKTIEYCCEHQELGYEWCPVCKRYGEDYGEGIKTGHEGTCWLGNILKDSGQEGKER